jgi:two-component system, OmpR family, sensor histidine kinase SenX3
VTFAVVFTAIGALMIGVLIGRRPGTVAPPQSTNDAAVTDVVQHNSVPLPNGRGAMEPADPAVELGLFRGLRPDERTSDEVDAVRMEGTWRDFVANVSHELKTPVGAVALLAEAVLDAADDPLEVRRFGTKILNEANRLGTLVTELIASSRLPGAEPLPEMATVEVDEVVRAALDRSGWRPKRPISGSPSTRPADSCSMVRRRCW